MKHASLFSGIGGFDLAAQWMGWENVFHCEINPFCQNVLSHHFPKSISHTDIKQTDFTIYANTIDILTGGFPCQPFSVAGSRRGSEDERHLWPEMFRAVREIRPRWIVGENVRGFITWNGGLVFEQVQADLESEGYKVQAYEVPAIGVDAPHERYRIIMVGYNPSNTGSGGRIQNNKEFTPKQFEQGVSDWRRYPAESPVCSRNDGISAGLDRITFPKWRSESIKAFGNAVVPQVVLQIFKAIEKYEQQ